MSRNLGPYRLELRFLLTFRASFFLYIGSKEVFMGISRRHFLRNVGLGLTGLSVSTEHTACNFPNGNSHAEKLLVKAPDHPEAATYDRLPLSWYKSTVKCLRDKVAEKGVDAILLQNRWNLVYFTGLFHSTHATIEYGTDLILRDIKKDGRLHTAD